MKDTNRHPSYQSLERATKSRDSGVIGLHEDNLFDEDERSSDGGMYDEASGVRYDNSTLTDETYYGATGTGRTIDTLNIGDSEDVMGELHQKNDDAAKWLAQHETTIVPVEDHQQKDVA